MGQSRLHFWLTRILRLPFLWCPSCRTSKHNAIKSSVLSVLFVPSNTISALNHRITSDNKIQPLIYNDFQPYCREIVTIAYHAETEQHSARMGRPAPRIGKNALHGSLDQDGPGKISTYHPLQDEIRRQKRRNALDRNLHIGPGIAIHISLENPGGKAELSGNPAKARVADESKGLVARKPRIGVNRGQINPIPLCLAEGGDQVPIGPNRAIGQRREAEDIRPGAAGHYVAPCAADQQVIPGTAIKRVIAR
jgi:hypothetical protein